MRRKPLLQEHGYQEHGYTLIEIIVVVAVFAVLAAAAVPMTSTSLSGYRFEGDAQSIAHTVSLAKMRAAAKYSFARVALNTSAGTFALQTWDRDANTWEDDSGTQSLSRGSSFSSASVTAPPPSEATLAFSDECTDDMGTVIPNTACITFNSRGLPIDPATSTVIGDNAFYVTNGVRVVAVTVMPTGQIRVYATNEDGSAWAEQR